MLKVLGLSLIAVGISVGAALAQSYTTPGATNTHPPLRLNCACRSTVLDGRDTPCSTDDFSAVVDFEASTIQITGHVKTYAHWPATITSDGISADYTQSDPSLHTTVFINRSNGMTSWKIWMGSHSLFRYAVCTPAQSTLF